MVELVPQANGTYDYESKVLIKEAIQVVGQELEGGVLWCRWYTLPLHTILKKELYRRQGRNQK